MGYNGFSVVNKKVMEIESSYSGDRREIKIGL